MQKLLLTDSKAYPWTQTDSYAFRGYFIIDGNLYRGAEAITFLEQQLNFLGFEDLLRLLNGIFSIVIRERDRVYLATDRIRGLPLFYSILAEQLIVSDSAHALYDVLPTATFDPVSVEDYSKNSLFVTGPYTFYREIKQVQAGEWIYFNCKSNELRAASYFQHADGIIDSRTEDELLETFTSVFADACENLNRSLAGRTAVVPLSGGVDSREILLMLHTIDYEKVICFSYGKKGSLECAIASEVAEHFGYKFIEITYTRKLWRELAQDPLYRDYLAFGGNLSSLPHTQDLLAVKLLMEDGLLPEDSVFLPGHTGTIIGDSLSEVFLNEKLVEYEHLIEVAKGAYKHGGPVSMQLDLRIRSYFDSNRCANNDQSAAQHHCFLMKERQAKFIINSVRVYEFLGYEWLLPLCDLHFLEFFKRLPLHLKNNKSFVRSFMGLDHIRSTRDQSLGKNISKLARSVSFSRVIGRKIAILQQYFGSTLQTGGKYGFLPFLKGFLLGNEYFGVNVIGCGRYLSLWGEKSEP